MAPKESSPVQVVDQHALGLGSPHMQLLNDDVQGRYLVSTSALDKKTELLAVASPYAFALFDNHKKRVYLCSPNCLATLLADGHHVVCVQLRRLATFKAPQHEKSVLKILLFILFRRHVERGRHLHTSANLRFPLLAESSPLSDQSASLSKATDSASVHSPGPPDSPIPTIVEPNEIAAPKAFRPSTPLSTTLHRLHPRPARFAM
ncbi:hypothetical protein HKX48_000827 [Thoreauomyces humboldtii]|nr:hypothetical protein HKX48_000827 [Thoreauomyces humboldtii]